MNLARLDEYTQRVLSEAGWYCGRRFDCGNWIELLKREGYQPHAYALEILAELGDIYICTKPAPPHCAATFNFNPYDSASGEYDRMGDFQNDSHDLLFPIGECFQNILYAGTSRRIYSGSWVGLQLVGESIEDFLNNMFSDDFVPVNIGRE
ncbi:MAG: hypothetical protein E7559_05625 [Ruminococcaceae bacterium]|nr:hypothetical protein [Oscillospiraceae bacterium]